MNNINVSKEILMDMKKRGETLLDLIKKLEKISGSNKKSKEAKKVVEKFLNCHITSPAILKRYHEVLQLMERFQNGL